MLWTKYRPVIKIGPKGTPGIHEIRPIHYAPSLGQSIGGPFSYCDSYCTVRTRAEYKNICQNLFLNAMLVSLFCLCGGVASFEMLPIV